MNNIWSKKEGDMEIDDFNDEETSNFKDECPIGDIADLCELCKAQCPLKYWLVEIISRMKTFFGTKCEGTVKTHACISNSKCLVCDFKMVIFSSCFHSRFSLWLCWNKYSSRYLNK